MKILLDTHILLWCFSDAPMLTPKMAYLIDVEDNEIYYSSASVWEIALKFQKHPNDFPITASKFEEYCYLSGFHELSISSKHILALNDLKKNHPEIPHNDPFDRIMLAQAQSEGIAFMTHDKLLLDYDSEALISV